MKSLLLLAAALLPTLALAQTAPTASAQTEATTDAAASIPLAPVTPAADPNALKIKADYNPIAKVLAVRCDAPGPTAIEINDVAGHPMLTKNVIAGTTAATFNVASLPAGPYVVHCTAGVKQGMRRVLLGGNN